MASEETKEEVPKSSMYPELHDQVAEKLKEA
jgi:hypothetical protein